MSDHREYRDELAAYALGALETAEKLEIERHLAGCEECSEYLLWLDPAVDLLPASVEPRTPPAAPQALAHGRGRGRPQGRAPRREGHASAPSAASGARSGGPSPPAFSPIVLVVGVAVGWLLSAATTLRARPSRPRASPRSARRWRRAWRSQGDEGTLHVVKLPGLGPDQDYQAWIQRDGDMEPSSTFDVREDGEVAIEGSLDGADGRLHHPRARGRLRGADRSPILMGVELLL